MHSGSSLMTALGRRFARNGLPASFGRRRRERAPWPRGADALSARALRAGPQADSQRRARRAHALAHQVEGFLGSDLSLGSGFGFGWVLGWERGSVATFAVVAKPVWARFAPAAFCLDAA